MTRVLTKGRRIAWISLCFCMAMPTMAALNASGEENLIPFNSPKVDNQAAVGKTESIPELRNEQGDLVSLAETFPEPINLAELAEELRRSIDQEERATVGAEGLKSFVPQQTSAEATQNASPHDLPPVGQIPSWSPSSTQPAGAGADSAVAQQPTARTPSTAALQEEKASHAQTAEVLPENAQAATPSAESMHAATAAAQAMPQSPAVLAAQQQAARTAMQAEVENALAAQQLQRLAEKQQQAVIQNVQDNTYQLLEMQALPMSPEQINRLHQRYDEVQRATEAFPGTPPKPVSTSLVVNLSPGTTPPVVRLGKGFVSSLVFVDATGAPWQIISYDVGAPDIFNVQWDKDSNMLLIQPQRPYTYGNIAVNLAGLNTPVMLTLVPGQRVIDYRVDLRVQALSPNPNQDLIGDGLPASADSDLLKFLNGAEPDAARKLRVSGSYTQVWVYKDPNKNFKEFMYVRSRYKVVSPSWLASMSSADGTYVYKLPKAPIILLSRHGKVVSMQIEGF